MIFNHLILALLVAIFWGINFIFVKLALTHFPPIFLCAVRFFITSIPAIFFVKKPNIELKWLILYSFFMFSLQFSLIFMGIDAGMPPGLASLLMQVQLFFSFFLAIFWLGEKITLVNIIGAVIAFSGIGIIWMNLDGNASILGFFLILCASMAWAAGNLITKKIGKVSVFSLVAWSAFLACPPLLLVSLVFEGWDNIVGIPQQITWLSVIAVLYIVYISTWLGYCIWSWLLNKYSIATITPFTLLVPVFGILSSAIVFDEPLNLWKICAGLLVISGLFINLLGQQFGGSLKTKLNRILSKLPE